MYGGDSVAGIIGLDNYESGEVIGDLLPHQPVLNLIDLQVGKYKIRNGDRKLVVRSDVYKSVAPQKTCNGEKNFNPHYMHLRISLKYDFLVMNENLRFVEYQTGGMSNSMWKQYRSSPRSFAEIRKLYLSFPDTSFKFRFRHCIHYVSSSIFSRNRRFLAESPVKGLTLLAIPFGAAFAMLVWLKSRK